MPRYCLRKHKEYNRWKNLLFDELCIKCEIRERLNDYFEILKSDKRDILSNKNKNFFGKNYSELRNKIEKVEPYRYPIKSSNQK